MTTTNQIEANRANALKSTGPRTPSGKAQARYNAMRHGMLAEAALLPDEDEAAFRALERALLEDLKPVGAQEAALVEEIINLTWRLRRDSQLEAGIFAREEAAEREEYWRSEASDMELTWEEFYQPKMVIPNDGSRSLPDHLHSVSDEELWAEAHVQAEEAAAVQGTDLALLGGAFIRDASGANALSKLGRYETNTEGPEIGRSRTSSTFRLDET